MWITKVSLSGVSEETRKQVMEAAEFCRQRDSTFKYTTESEVLTVESTSKDQAYKRGSYFHLKFGVYYNVEWRKEEHG